MTGAAGGTPPFARIAPARRVPAVWLVPVAALVLAAWLAYQAWASRGLIVTVHLDQGHGLRSGDAVRYRGIVVGEVRDVRLGADGVLVTASLTQQGDMLARGGSRVWVVRPRLGLSAVEGLETLIGPRYLAILPGGGAQQRHFVGLPEAPVVEQVEPGDLEVILVAEQTGSVRPGSPVSYRQVRVGTVLSTGLASDGGSVEARVHIEQPFARLVRADTRFWPTGGFEAHMGISGLSLELESLESLVAGGIALATPPGAGDAVRTGHRFTLDPAPPDGWLQWQPLAVIGSDLLPPGAPRPTPLRAKIAWKQGLLIARARSRGGWLLPTSEGLLGPADLLQASAAADQETVELEVAGELLSLVAPPLWSGDGLAFLAAAVPAARWPAERTRRPGAPEDCLAFGDPSAPPLPLAATRLTPQADGWRLDPAIPLDPTWHGACVLSRSDGFLIGMLLVDDGEARVALVPQRP